jgi:hypothetical protein
MDDKTHDFPDIIKNMFAKNNRDNFCHEVVMLTQYNDFDSFIENEGPIEHIFNLSIEYADNMNKPEQQDQIWNEITKAVNDLK